MRIVTLLGLILGALLSSNAAWAPRQPDPSALETAIHQQVNGYRVEKGMARLSWDDRLAERARAHSSAMARGAVSFGHSGFRERIRAAGIRFSSAAENVGENQGYDEPAAQAVEGWLASKGHRANIEGNFNITGVGVARRRDGTYFFTQVFMLTR